MVSGVVLLGEALTAGKVVGGIVIVLGVYLRPDGSRREMFGGRPPDDPFEAHVRPAI